MVRILLDYNRSLRTTSRLPRMRDRLLLRLSPTGDLHWLRAGAAAASSSIAGVPPKTARDAAGEIVVLVPSADVLLTRARIAARNRAQLLQAVPFAVEEQLLDPVESLHFGAWPEADGETGIAVVAKDTLRDWLARLAAHGIEPDRMLPDSLLLPVGGDRAHALIEDDVATVRLGTGSAFACTPGELPDWLHRIGAPALEVDDFRAAPALALPGVAAYRERQRDPLAFLARQDVPAANLLCGKFAPRRRAGVARPWKLAAALAAVALLLAFVGLGVEAIGLSRESDRLDARMRDAVREAFPDVDAATLARVSPEQLVRERVEGGRAGGGQGVLALLSAAGPVIADTRQVQTRGIEYRNGRLEIALLAPDVGTLDRVRERLALAPGFTAEVTAANPVEDGIDGRIRLAPSAAGGAP